MSHASTPLYPEAQESDKQKYKSPTGECLEDRSKKGRVKPWRQHKQTTEKLGECYIFLGWEKKAANVERCATYLEFLKCTVDESHHSKLIEANFCRDRMCSQCQWRKSMRQFSVAVKVGHELRRREKEAGRPESQFIFLTLTIPNVSLEELSVAIDQLFTGWKLLRQRKEVRNITNGYYRDRDDKRKVIPLAYHRALEITYNATTNTFHPHIHAAIVVPSDYFESMKRSKFIQQRDEHGELVRYQSSHKKKGITKGDVKFIRNPHYYYIPQKEWLEMWREAMRMPEITQVDVRKIRGKKGQDEITSGFAEACKYSLKYWASTLSKEELKRIKKKAKAAGVDFGMEGHIWMRESLEKTAGVVKQLSKALENRRLVQFGGVLRDIKRDLKLKGAEEGGDLVNTSDEKTECTCPVCDADTISHLYRWFSDVRDYIG